MSPNRKAAEIATAAFLALSLTAAGAAAQPEAEGMTATLNDDGRVLFLKVLDLEFHVAATPTGHNSSARISSFGVLSAFKKFDIKAEESGPVAHGQPAPGVFRYENHDGKNNRKVEVTWDGQDVVTQSTPVLTFMGDPPATRAQKLGAVGYLTAMLRLSLADGSGPCHGAETIFNGKELSELGFTAPRAMILTDAQKQMGLTNGLRCTAVFREIAGYHKKTGKARNQGLNGGIEADFARLGEDGPWIPLKMEAQTPLGPADVELTRMSFAGKLPTGPVESASR